MVRCEILVASRYSDYAGSGTNRKARYHSEGEVVLFPRDYALLLVENDMVVILDETLVEVEGDNGEEVTTIEIDQADQIDETPKATESALEYAAEHNIDLKNVEATGTEGQIILRDVRVYHNSLDGG